MASVGMDVGQEVRFAIVMYGGVSLAIYINGVAQELLRLVQATAADPSDETKPFHDEVDGSTEIYRRIGQLLGRAGLDGGKPHTDADPIRTRFVVDVISGTSAGGINGIYLGKALANGQNIDDLENLWIKKGDVGTLLNDGKKLPRQLRQDPPRSLLSSQYMYQELLNAFEGMDDDATDAPPTSPYAEDLDVFVTTTDIRGLPFPLRLWDRVVHEKRHKNVFRFRYRKRNGSTGHNDFVRDNNPLLAFAARCTSAFPFAFEPASPKDALDRVKVEEGKPHPWTRFFPAYRVPPGTETKNEPKYDWKARAFGDGGYLDNKPFSHAIDVLGSRRSSIPVDRKLIYVEPDPEEIDWAAAYGDDMRPNAIENVNAALSLARYETIREDLERILARNRLLERVDRILSGMEEDISISQERGAEFARASFREAPLRDGIRAFGAGYGGYHRLKVAAVTDQITAIVAEIAGFDPESDQFQAIRLLVREWRTLTYEENGENGRQTENAFLFHFDLSYRVRRVDFVLRKIDQLFCLNDQTSKLLKSWQADMPPPEAVAQRGVFRRELKRLSAALEEPRRDLRKALKRIVLDPGVRAACGRLELTAPMLRAILEANGEARNQLIQSTFGSANRQQALQDMTSAVAAFIGGVARSAADRCEEALGGAAPGQGEAPVATMVRTVVRGYYTSFEKYDRIAFPILFSTEVGEEMDPIEVVRVSPGDATAIKKNGERKLAGISLMHFGAFLDEGFRRNDMLWGRLDGAERLINILLHGTVHAKLAPSFVKEAQIAILKDTYDAQRRNQLCELMSRAIDGESISDPKQAALRREIIAKKPGQAVNARVAAALEACLDPEELYKYLESGYEVNVDLDRRTMTDVAGRATRVTGKILEDISNQAQVTDRPGIWLARAGSALSALVELALPTQLLGDVGRRILALAVFFAVFLFVVGLALNEPSIQKVGALALVFTIGFWALSFLLRDFIMRRQGWKRALAGGAALVTGIALLLAVLGALHVPKHATELRNWLGGFVGGRATAAVQTSGAAR